MWLYNSPALVSLLVALALAVGPARAAAPEAAEQPWLREAEPLPPPEGPVVHVDTVESLIDAIEDAAPGVTIMIADGHYLLPRYVEIRADHVTLRSLSGDRTAVVLDGAESRHGELIGIRHASHVTIAELTVQNVRHNGIKINNDTPVHHVTIRNCVVRNVWQRGVKSVRSPELKSRGGVIEHCLFYNDRPKRFDDDPRDNEQTFGGNYVGAIDLMDATGWVIRDNVFVNIQGRTRTGRGAIFIWFESEDCVIERNVIVDCDQGIALGNAHRPEDTPWHASRFVVRNNFITRAPMNPMFLAYTRDVEVLHNTIHDPENGRQRSVRIFADNPQLQLTANIVHGYPFATEQVAGELTVSDNLVSRDLPDIFEDADLGDLRLRPLAGEAVPDTRRSPSAPDDITASARRAPTKPGAHQP